LAAAAVTAGLVVVVVVVVADAEEEAAVGVEHGEGDGATTCTAATLRVCRNKPFTNSCVRTPAADACGAKGMDVRRTTVVVAEASDGNDSNGDTADKDREPGTTDSSLTQDKAVGRRLASFQRCRCRGRLRPPRACRMNE
jgi:hypothetical protein